MNTTQENSTGDDLLKPVTSVFANSEEAQQALARLDALGYPADEITIIASKDTMKQAFPGRVDETMNRRAAEGAAYGGTLGAVTGVMFGLLGPGVVVAGPLVAALVGGAGLGAAGAALGAWSGMGVPDDHHSKYEELIRQGGIVLAVTPKQPDDEPKLRAALDGSHTA